MAVTANQLIEKRGQLAEIPAPVLGSTTLYQGTLAFWERTSGSDEGYALGDDDSGANNFAGVVKEKCDNASGSSGDKTATLHRSGSFVLQGTGFTRAIVGDKCYATDNFTVTATSTSATYIGEFEEYISTTKMWVRINPEIPDA
jgi:hypothetical protein